MTSSIIDFVRSVSVAHRERRGFEASMEIRAGAIEIAARIRHRSPDHTAVEFRTYNHPLSDLEETLANGATLTGEELLAVVLHYDGRHTWRHDASSNVAVRTDGRELFEPIPGFDALGELGFLDHLAHDFLVRDGGQDTVAGRDVRLVSLKPKRTYRSQLLRAMSYPIRKATVAFDAETFFPLRISFYPDVSTSAAALVGPTGVVTVQYSDVRYEAPGRDALVFAPDESIRTFIEIPVSTEDLSARMPFLASLEPLTAEGFLPPDGRVLVAASETGERTYCRTLLLATGSGEETRGRITLRAGNYLSRNMSRRRAAIAEKGKPVTIGGKDAKLLDRGQLFVEHLPQIDAPASLEWMWEEAGAYWFLLFEGIPEARAAALCTSLREANAPGKEGSPATD